MEGALQHFGNPNIEQRNLDEGKAVVNLGARTIVSVSGVDRLEWLHSLLSQNLKNLLPGVSAEALLLDPQGHIEQVIHFLDDGEKSWLILEAQSRESFIAWLNKMIFRMRVEISDHSDNFAVLGSIGLTIPDAFISNDVPLIWQDPWPGVVTGGVRYSMARPAKWAWSETLVENAIVESVLAKYEKAG
ncbi:MAG: folate-binding protein, partial [Actinobacteria bacterium]|nr:folate-binding protein [Actinomycetota bacterium]